MVKVMAFSHCSIVMEVFIKGFDHKFDGSIAKVTK